MAEQQGILIIHQLRRHWMIYQLLIHSLMALSIALLSGHILHATAGLSFAWIAAFFILILGGLIIWRNPWEITEATVTRFLNQQYPELEESSHLLLQPQQQLNLLAQLQWHKVAHALQVLPVTSTPFKRQLRVAIITFVGCVILSLITAHLPFKQSSTEAMNTTVLTSRQLPKEHILSQINAVHITIIPPAYTLKATRRQDRFSLNVEDGAAVNWQITTNVKVNKIALLLNGKTRFLLGSNNQKIWTAHTIFTAPGFYQVSIDGKLSDLYPVQIIKDAPPVIHIKTPKQYTYIDAGETPKVLMTAQVSDDYGIVAAMLVATVAKGSGEAVKFKEYRMPFAMASNKHQTQYNLQKLFDLPTLEMEPGDELYFYLQAQDNHRQHARTDVYKVTLQDTAQLLSMDGLVAGSTLKPEFFRSERQIILDTEGLLKAKDSISTAEFNTRCNDIATDQKLLRLRYGKFLGEEDEGKIGEAEGSDLGAAENFSNAAKIMDAYTDKHDNAEDATFFEPAIKAQLKATLNEMWRAELQLRLYKPNAALPYEYKALRLLKDLQQKSRAYVVKTNYNPPPLKFEKRLSGDLSKVNNPISQQQGKPVVNPAAGLLQAAAVLAQAHQQPSLGSSGKQALQRIVPQINNFAARNGNSLSAVNTLRRLLTTRKASLTDLNQVEAIIQKMLPQAKTLPSASAATPDMGLSQSYYRNLNRYNR
ncbi:DUF4175 domain-containing protein [Mucilaginibacter koreensis]